MGTLPGIPTFLLTSSLTCLGRWNILQKAWGRRSFNSTRHILPQSAVVCHSRWKHTHEEHGWGNYYVSYKIREEGRAVSSNLCSFICAVYWKTGPSRCQFLYLLKGGGLRSSWDYFWDKYFLAKALSCDIPAKLFCIQESDERAGKPFSYFLVLQTLTTCSSSLTSLVYLSQRNRRSVGFTIEKVSCSVSVSASTYFSESLCLVSSFMALLKHLLHISSRRSLILHHHLPKARALQQANSNGKISTNSWI